VVGPLANKHVTAVPTQLSLPSCACSQRLLPTYTENSLLVLTCCCIALQNSHGVHAAREFVWWYNGHPDQRELPVDLSRVESVAVCGIGNVALDCARILLRPVSELAPTDIARHALKQLQHSKVRQVQLCARRGPVQVRLSKGSSARG
jgi:hypothetical protein